MSRAGLLLVDKPVGPTSHDIVGMIRKTAGIRQVGHAGTLDPFASGLLLVLLGGATRLSEYLLGLDKEYEATIRLGIETDTHDPEGDVKRETSAWKDLRRETMEEALTAFRGSISQRPPQYSAKKIRGEAAHRRVRRGEEVELEPVSVTVHRLELQEVDFPKVRLLVNCSSGTYIRALARDLGRALGVGGHLSALRRTSIGPHSVSSALPLDALAEPEAIWKELTPPGAVLGHFPIFEVGPEEAARIRHGQFLPLPSEVAPAEGPVRVLLKGELVAVATRQGDQLRPQKVFGAGS
ncbi:MAG: tRNA pseudouridine(55) synthase TruB [Gemmatimonadota bacterium]|jgi:tRNA pseudouridine55 synthase